jgi:hypothetical protein
MTNWIKQKPVYEISEECIATVVKEGFRINAVFGRAVGNKRGAEIFFDESGRKVGIKFLDEPSADSFTVSNDGGGSARVTNSKVINCGSAVSGNPILSEMRRGPKDKARIKFSKDGDMWEAVLIPVFDRDVNAMPPKNDDVGVYRYLFDNQVVYIGQGNIKLRLAAPERKDWVFDKIEYFITLDSTEAITLETLYIEDFKKEFKRLPMFNKVSGVS